MSNDIAQYSHFFSRKLTCNLAMSGSIIKDIEHRSSLLVPGSSMTCCTNCFQELYDTLEKERPSLFRLASDTEDKDQDAISMYFSVMMFA